METVTPILKADKAQMAHHLGLLFGRALQGRVEITAIKADATSEDRPRTRFFDVDQLDEAADYAADLNSEHMWNVYVGAAVRDPDVFPGKAATDEDFYRAWAIHADVDDGHDLPAVRERYRQLGITPPFVVVTGRTPTTRAQLWWPLDEPIKDPDVYRQTLRAVAACLHTDPAVTAAKQLMRLAGTVNWPKAKKVGRVLEKTEVVEPEGAQPAFSIEQIQRAFPPAAAAEPRHEADHQPGTLAGAMAHHDLRSALASMRSDDRDLWIRMGHALRGLGDQGRGLWLEWSQTSDKYDPADAARVWDSFQPQRTGFQAVFAEAQRRGWVNPAAAARAADPVRPHDVSPPADPDDVFEVLSIADIRAMPDAQWLIKDAIPAEGLAFIYGPPASFKSFVCYDLALSYAYGAPEWIGHERKAEGAVLYLASEGISGAKNRIHAWQVENGVAEDTDRFHLIRKTINFLSQEDRDRLVRTVSRHVELHGPVSLIFVDTVSRVLPGADENLQKDMTLFVGACDALREFGATVVGVHHTNKQGEMRGSTVFLGQGDAVFRVEREEGARTGVLTCEKLKDAEDGWKRAFEVKEHAWTTTTSIEPVSSLVAVFTGDAPQPTEPQDAWPARSVCKDILKALHEAWNRGKPWSPYPQTSKEGRFAVRNISSDFGLPGAQVQMMLEAWLKNDVVSLETVDSHSKTKGLKVLQWLD